ncbi:hypothetical protein HDU84_007617 [Entophlyctis sp. JEL0112]|nr:hypothetical protein HDU84_007617 [Entophlyctis sp. JEL0112]
MFVETQLSFPHTTATPQAATPDVPAADYALCAAAHPACPAIAATDRDSARVCVWPDPHSSPAAFAPTTHPNARAVRLLWHPSKRLLAVAWDSGVVGVWSEADQILREGVSHAVRVCCLQWNAPGSRLISCDEDAQVVVWKVDLRGKLSLMCQYRLKSPVSSCLFRCSTGRNGAVENAK